MYGSPLHHDVSQTVLVSWMLILASSLLYSPGHACASQGISVSASVQKAESRERKLDREMAGNDHRCCEAMFWAYLMISAGLVMFAGLMSGLTLGLMSLSLVDLEVLAKAGQPRDRANAGQLFIYLSLLVVYQNLN